ncbi:unnamed protein product [Paramecium sonneborni]|uniref:Uncharacterized protein n=1 Tax=Paramecium sonneborni TaxID=65129 RepID=A0A8S1NMP3_9CILI|nr:unnamed protein product [Paramecium sonneborni]
MIKKPPRSTKSPLFDKNLNQQNLKQICLLGLIQNQIQVQTLKLQFLLMIEIFKT